MDRPPAHVGAPRSGSQLAMTTAAPTAPALRQVTAEVLTPVGWMNGTFRVPPQQPFFDFLTLGTLGVQILKFTRVRVPNEPDPVPFVALQIGRASCRERVWRAAA